MKKKSSMRALRQRCGMSNKSEPERQDNEDKIKRAHLEVFMGEYPDVPV